MTDAEGVLADARERRIREEFSAAGETVYLNTAAEGLGSATQERALARYALAKRRGSKGREEMAETASATKARLACLPGCRAADVALFSSTSEAIGVVLRGLPWQSGDNVVITDLEFPGAMVACLSLAWQVGIDVRVVAHRDGDIESESIAARIDDRTRLVILSHVSFHSGCRFDLERITEIAHDRGARVLVDASQSLGAVPVTVGDVDWLVACSFKWLVGSHGVGLLYARPGLEEELSRHVFGWRGVTDFLGVMRTQDFTPREGAARFESGMPNYPAIYALHDALELLDVLQPAWIEQRIGRHVDAINDTCRDLGLRVLTPSEPTRRAGIVAFAHPEATAIGEALSARGVVTWYGDGRVRCSPHFYTTADDVLAFQSILAEVLQQQST